jgi:hypothetical protein
MKLIITNQSKRHINYLLTRYKSTEWSGPAFYQVTHDEKGFPSIWTLKGFVTLDLGDTTSTEWDGDDWIEISKKIYGNHPEYKECFIGLIHSHHNMGAFFSGTDKTQLEEAANKVGYGSLVVAHSKERFAFAISYIDNFGKSHMFECKDIELQGPKVKPLQEWVDYADKMDKEKKTAPTYHYGHGNQLSLYNNGYGKPYGFGKGPEDVIEAEFEKAEKAMTQAEKLKAEKKISKKAYKKIEKRFNKASKDYTEMFGEETDGIAAWNESFGII